MDERKPLVILKRLKDEDASEYPDTKLLAYENEVVFIDAPEPGHRGVKTVIHYDEIKEVEALHSLFGTGSLEIITYKKKSYKAHHSNGDLVSQARRIIDKKIKSLQFEKRINGLPLTYAYHSVTISVKNLGVSEKFYELLGFKKVYERKIKNKSFTVSQLKNRWFLLELFCYFFPQKLPKYPQEADNYLVRGVKYFALKVPSVKRAREDLIKKGIAPYNRIKQSETETRHFFIKDPDGILIEIVQDDRYLDPQHFLWVKERKKRKRKPLVISKGLPEDQEGWLPKKTWRYI